MSGLPLGEPRVWPTGTHSLRITTPGGVWSESAAQFEVWTLAYADATNEDALGECPRVTLITALDEDIAEFAADLDAALVPGVGYTLTGPSTDTHLFGTYAFTGPRRSLELLRTPDDRALLDIDAPVLAGSEFTLDETRDWALSSGTATEDKVIWTRLLEPQGARYWRPDLGSGFTLKALRPLDVRDAQKRAEAQLAGIPYVRAVSVQLTWDTARMMVVTVRAQTDFGRLETSRGVQ